MSCIAMLFAACSDTENLESQMKEQNASTRADVPEMLTIHYNGNTYENVPTRNRNCSIQGFKNKSRV